MPIKVNGATSGSVTLAAPASGSDVTLTLPTLGFGKVLQVVHATYGTYATSSSTSFADTGLSASITPSSTGSKILVLVNQNGVGKFDTNNAVFLRLLRGSTVLSTWENRGGYTGGTTATVFVGSSSFSYLDSPNTTSATTYKTQFAALAASAGASVQQDAAVSSILLMEVMS